MGTDYSQFGPAVSGEPEVVAPEEQPQAEESPYAKFGPAVGAANAQPSESPYDQFGVSLNDSPYAKFGPAVGSQPNPDSGQGTSFGQQPPQQPEEKPLSWSDASWGERLTKPLTETVLGLPENWHREGAGPIETGIEKGVTGFVTGLTSPLNIGLMVATGGLGSLAEGLGAEGLEAVAPELVPVVTRVAGVASKLANAGFTGEQLWNVTQHAIPQFYIAAKNGDTEGAAEALTDTLLGGAAAAMSTMHLAKNAEPEWSPNKEVVGTYQNKVEIANAEARQFELANKDLLKDKSLDMAARLYHESGSDVNKLEQWRSEIANDWKVDPATRTKFEGLIKQAQNLPDDVRALSARLRIDYASDWEEAVKALKRNPEENQGVENYAGQHKYEPSNETSTMNRGPRMTKKADFMKERTFPTYIDALKAGYVPKDIGLAAARADYIRKFGLMKGAIAAEDSMLNQTAPDGRPLAVTSSRNYKDAAVTSLGKLNKLSEKLGLQFQRVFNVDPVDADALVARLRARATAQGENWDDFVNSRFARIVNDKASRFADAEGLFQKRPARGSMVMPDGERVSIGGRVLHNDILKQRSPEPADFFAQGGVRALMSGPVLNIEAGPLTPEVLDKIHNEITDFYPHAEKVLIESGGRVASMTRDEALQSLQDHNVRLTSPDILFQRGKFSKEFNDWFKGSKIIDKNGKPLVLYHGTRSRVPFTDFATDGLIVDPTTNEFIPRASGADPSAYLGAHFTNERGVANKFATGKHDWMVERSTEHGRVAPVYLSIKKPMDFGAEANMQEFILSGSIDDELALNEAAVADGVELDSESPKAQAWEKRYDNDPKFRAKTNSWILNNSSESASALAESLADQAKTRLMERGYDGVKYDNEVEGGKAIVAFTPDQIKPALSPDSEGGFYQKNKSEAKGMTEFLKDGRAILRGFETADYSTLAHELGHVFRRDLAGRDLKTIERWAGVKNGEWTKEAEEKFAQGAERYLQKGDAEDSEILPVFERFKNWLKAVYSSFIGSPSGNRIPKDVQKVYNNLFGVEQEVAPRYGFLTNATGNVYMYSGDYVPAKPPFERYQKIPIGDKGAFMYKKTPLLLHPDYGEKLNKIFNEPSYIRKIPVLSHALKFNSELKKVLLSFSPFHYTTEALRGIQMGLSPREVWSPPKLMPDDPAVEVGTKYGLTLLGDSAQRSMYQEGTMQHEPHINRIPGVGKALRTVEDHLFGEWIPRLKALSWNRVVASLEKAQPEWSDAQRYEFAGKIVNSAYGGLNWKQLGYSLTSQDALRLLFLAPDFSGSQLLFAKYSMQPGGSPVRQSFVRILAWNMAVAQTLNLLITGRTQMSHPFSVTDPSDPSKVISVRTMPEDIYRAITEPRSFITNRIAPLSRDIHELAFGTNIRGQKVGTINMLADVLKNSMPISAQGLLPWFKNPGVTWEDQALHSAGLTVLPDVTPALLKARELGSASAPSQAMTPTELQQWRFKAELETGLRDGTVKPTTLTSLVEKGKLTLKEAHTIRDRVRETRGMSPLVAQLFLKVYYLPFKDALQVWDAADNEERQAIARLMRKKRISYRQSAFKNDTVRERREDPIFQRTEKEYFRIKRSSPDGF